MKIAISEDYQGFEKVSDKACFFNEATVAWRSNEHTAGIVKTGELSLMKPTAVCINTARAELIENGALRKCLKAGRPGFAGIDVGENESVKNVNFELLRLPNVVFRPHLGYVGQNSCELHLGKAFESVANYSQGGPIHIVNPEVLK